MAKMELKKSSGRKYSETEDRWIAEHLNSETYAEMAERFTAEFGRQTTGAALRHRAGRLGLNGKKCNSSRFAVGEPCKHKVSPVGAERVTDGFVYVKVSENRGVYNKRCPGGYADGGNWRKKAYINWEKAYGSIPEGKRLIYLDGNKLNCDVSNLYFATIKVQLRLGRTGWQFTDPELTLTAIKFWELYYAIKEMGGEDE